ncbi:hypothetical protein [Pseudomonas sp. HY7a-MNA-CIBAN-0227]|uniref:hypothetical protein n=1 Tax=Pseudomonas sp. HY7a-MNA-CIBAN-0227 TaxID=3140474 RepID=UPI003316D5B3
MNNQFKEINDIRDEFISTNKSVFTDERQANKHDFESNISITAYHNLIIADVVDLFYDIHVQNINNLVDEIAIKAYADPTAENRLHAGRAQEIQEHIMESIDQGFGDFNAMSTKERAGLVSNLSVTLMSPTVIEKARKDIIEGTMEKDPTYKHDIMNHVRTEISNVFVDYAKNLNDDFHRKYSQELKELSSIQTTFEKQISLAIEPIKPDTQKPQKFKQKIN